MTNTMRPIGLTLLTLAVILSTPAFARGNSHGQHHFTHGRSHFSTLPATNAAPRYCASTNRHVMDARDCPEATIKAPNEIAVGTIENR